MTPMPPAVMEALARCPALGGVAIEIKGKMYDVAPLDPGEYDIKAYRLAKRDEATDPYDVVLHADGMTTCTCAQYTYRLANTSSKCKHGIALIRAGLLPDVIPLATKRREL